MTAFMEMGCISRPERIYAHIQHAKVTEKITYEYTEKGDEQAQSQLYLYFM
ncbi:hypothetical protein U3A59_20790 [Algoriphagus sp. E1-3-M2]|nr:hypothetical protein [Algoriphagus sp. E1-3-M2]